MVFHFARPTFQSCNTAHRRNAHKPSKQKREPRTVTALHRWLERARASGIELIRNFAYLLRRDILAVEAAVTEKWSNGPVEGQVNRLKTIKRQMYSCA